MAKNYSVEEVKTTIMELLKTIDTQFVNAKAMTYKEACELTKDLKSLFNLYSDLDYKACSELARKRYIPLLNLLAKISTAIPERTEYYKQLENAYKLAGRYDFESFVIYYEWEETDKFYEPRYEILGGYAYYLDKMAKDPDFELIVANLPSGAGKTYLEKLAEAWSFGIDNTGTMLALCSNDDVVKGGSRTVRDIMKSERFGDVFPKMRFSKDNRDYFLKETENEWKLKGCRLSSSYYAKTTQANVIGCRASKWIHIDDLYADYKEALDEQLNMYFFNKLVTVWKKRYVQGKKAKLVITGTMWSPNDFMVKVISLYESREKFIPHPKFKYTRISMDGKKVIIQVPALDMETGESSCKSLWETKELLQERDSMDTYLWETNFQQNPTTPEALEFDYKNLRTYDIVPINEYGATYSVIDGTRKSGKDFFSMPILQPYGDDYALIDCIYTKVATSELIEDIVDKIINNNIKILVIETNVDGGLKKIIEEKLKGRGFNNGIQIIEKYSTVAKATRIEIEKGTIKNRIVFPARNRHGANTPLGRFMQSLTIYNSQGRNEHDDACFAGDTLIATQFGYKKIKDIKVGDKVITPFGLRKVINCGITGYKKTINKFGLSATPNHKVYNCINNKFTPIDTFTSLSECDTISLGGLIKWKKKLLNLMGKSIKEAQRVDIILSTQQEILTERTANNCTELYGNTTTEKYQKGIKFIILTKILTITTFLTWLVFQLANIYHSIQKKCGLMKNIVKRKAKKCEAILLYSKSAKSGTKVKQANNGIENTQKTLFLKTRLEKKENAKYAGKHSILLGTKQKPAQKSADCNSNIPVYNITVENAGCYYANGILVSNCDSLAMFSNQIIGEKARSQKAKPIKRPF